MSKGETMFKCELTGKEYDLNDENEYKRYVSDKDKFVKDLQKKTSSIIKGLDGKNRFNGLGKKYVKQSYEQLSEYDTMSDEEFYEFVEKEYEAGLISLSESDIKEFIRKFKEHKTLRQFDTSRCEMGEFDKEGWGTLL